MIKIGTGQIDITPEPGIPLVGFAGRADSNGVHDRLYATALVANSDFSIVGIVSCDLLGICDDIVASIRAAVEEQTGLPGHSLMIACTHTHYGPNLYKKSSREDESRYQKQLPMLIAQVVGDAMANQQEARAGVGWGISDIGINRRERLADGAIVLGQNPGGPIDRTVGVCRFDSLSGDPLAIIANFATHPVSQAGECQSISADYPGKARDVVTKITGARCLFLQGACGDINPIRMEHSYEPARSLGARLGCEIVRVAEIIVTSDCSKVEAIHKTINLPRYRHGSRKRAATLASDLKDNLAYLKKINAPRGEIYWATSRLRDANDAHKSWLTGLPAAPIVAEIGGFCIGPLAIATAPGEIFNEIGTEVKATSIAKHTFFAGYTGGTVGYVPTPTAYAEGGYEVTHACKVDPEASELIVAKATDLIATVWRNGDGGRSG